jgi:hypothetical protein
MDTVLPSAVVSALPCDSQSVNAGAIANTNAQTIMTIPRTVFTLSSLDDYVVAGGHSCTVITPAYP